MGTTPPRQPAPKPADNEAAWPALAALLAPAAGCDCQMLAVTIARELDGKAPPVAKPRIAER